jgi:hypothetical protein
LLGVDLGWDQRQQFGLDRIDFVQRPRDVAELVGERVDAIEGIE